MKDTDNIITIKILDRTYSIKCPPHETQRLQESAKLVDEQMRKMQHSGGVNNAERVAVVTALNMCSELLQLKMQQNQYIEAMNQRINELQNRIQHFITDTNKVTA